MMLDALRVYDLCTGLIVGVLATIGIHLIILGIKQKRFNKLRNQIPTATEDICKKLTTGAYVLERSNDSYYRKLSKAMREAVEVLDLYENVR